MFLWKTAHDYLQILLKPIPTIDYDFSFGSQLIDELLINLYNLELGDAQIAAEAQLCLCCKHPAFLILVLK